MCLRKLGFGGGIFGFHVANALFDPLNHIGAQHCFVVGFPHVSNGSADDF
jgi:hypothetical protein